MRSGNGAHFFVLRNSEEFQIESPENGRLSFDRTNCVPIPHILDIGEHD
jgi:hypothetical protein